MEKLLIGVGFILVLFSTKFSLIIHDYFLDVSTVSTGWDIRIIGIFCFTLGIINILNTNNKSE